MKQDERSGITAALAAYIFWGLAPIYFKLIQSVAATEVIAHRVLWSIPALAIFLLLRDGKGFWQRMRLPRRTVLTLLVSGLLVAGNWLVFVWAVVNGQVLATSLGYFIGPLVSFLLGFLFLKERLMGSQISVIKQELRVRPVWMAHGIILLVALLAWPSRRAGGMLTAVMRAA